VNHDNDRKGPKALVLCPENVHGQWNASCPLKRHIQIFKNVLRNPVPRFGAGFQVPAFVVHLSDG
jgi:hypothetical protein